MTDLRTRVLLSAVTLDLEHIRLKLEELERLIAEFVDSNNQPRPPIDSTQFNPNREPF